MPHRALCTLTRQLAVAVFVAAPSCAESLAGAHSSDPVRNPAPGEWTPPDDPENPIYYEGPMAGSNVGDVSGVVPEALLQEFLQKHSSLNYPAAAELAMRLIEVIPDRPIGYYNLACALSRLGRSEEALDALTHAVERGWRDLVHTNIDPDFAPLRGEARFADIINDLRRRIESERIVPLPLRSDPWQEVVADLLGETPGLLAQHHVPGASISLVRDGEVVWSAAFGLREARGEISLGADDRFRLRAPLHLLAIAACDQLEQQRKLQLAPLIVEAANQHGDMTLVDTRGGAIGVQPANLRDRGQPAREFVANVRMPARIFSRDSAYGFLRMAVEQAADQPFPQYCEQNLLIPLAIRKSTFASPGEGVQVVTGHSALGTPLRPNVLQGEFAPGGCMYMTAGDVARLIASTIARSPVDSGGGAAQAEREGALPAADSPMFGDEWSIADAERLSNAIDVVTKADAALSGSLGLAIKRFETTEGLRYQLDEAAAGVVLLARWHPQTRSGVVVLCNSVSGRDVAERIAHIALGGE